MRRQALASVHLRRLLLRASLAALSCGAIAVSVVTTAPLVCAALARHDLARRLGICRMSIVDREFIVAWYQDVHGRDRWYLFQGASGPNDAAFREAKWGGRRTWATVYGNTDGGFPFSCIRFWYDGIMEPGVARMPPPIAGFPPVLLDRYLWGGLLLNFATYATCFGVVFSGWVAMKHFRRLRNGVCAVLL